MFVQVTLLLPSAQLSGDSSAEARGVMTQVTDYNQRMSGEWRPVSQSNTINCDNSGIMFLVHVQGLAYAPTSYTYACIHTLPLSLSLTPPLPPCTHINIVVDLNTLYIIWLIHWLN